MFNFKISGDTFFKLQKEQSFFILCRRFEIVRKILWATSSICVIEYRFIIYIICYKMSKSTRYMRQGTKQGNYHLHTHTMRTPLNRG